MWECDDKVCCDGYYLTNPTTDAGSATFSKDFAQFPHVVFTIHVVELGSGFKVGFVSSPQDGGVPEKIQLLEVTGEGSVAGSHPICKNESNITVQVTDKQVAVYVDDMTVSNYNIKHEKTAHPHLTLAPGAALLFDMSLSLSNVATSVTVLRKQGITCTNPDPYTFHLDAISNTLNKDSTSCSVIFDRVISAKHHFYQLKIVECGADSAVGIGLADRSHEPTKFPGWKKKSCGYHSDDGILYKKGHHNKVMPTCVIGDIMGCGIRFPDRDLNVPPRGNGEPIRGETVEVYFTKNALEVGDVSMTVPEGGFYPTIGLSEGDRVSVDFSAASG
ncbi:hypothetical protein ACHWQZ_G016507 [Mnemiopsis leidyi]